jgi:hypothetical protein
MSDYRDVSFTDELLSDGSVHRRFSDGRQEWRRRGAAGRVEWNDNQGGRGTDEPLAGRLIKRQYADGRTVYGRDQGYGRTAWSDGTLTINRTAFGGRVGAILAAVGGVGLLGAIVAPPLVLSAAEEEQLRQQQAQQQSSSDGGGDGGGGDSGSDPPGHEGREGHWGDHTDSHDDFG